MLNWGLDNRTLLLVAGAMYMILPASIWVILRMPRQWPAVLWCLSNLGGGVGLILIGLRGQVADFWSYGAGQILLALGAMCAAQSLRLDLGRPWPWRWIGGFAVLYAVSLWLLLEAGNVQAKGVVIRAFNLVAVAALVISAWQIGKEQASRNALMIAAAYSVQALGLIANMLNALLGSTDIGTLANNHITVSVSLVALVVVFFSTMGYLGLFLERAVRRNLALAAEIEMEHQWQDKRRTLVALDRERTLTLLAGSLSHAMTQPLTAAMLRLQTCVRRLTGGSLPAASLLEMLDKAMADLQRTSDIIQRIRHFVRPSVATHTSVDLAPLLVDVEKLLRQEAINRNIDLHVEPGKAPAWVMGDALQLSQAVLQIAHNALTAAATSQRRWVSLSLHSSVREAIILVRDSGAGFAEPLLNEPFEALRSFDQSMQGIGLFVVRDILQQHHGRLVLENAAAGGAIVTILLPLLTETRKLLPLLETPASP